MPVWSGRAHAAQASISIGLGDRPSDASDPRAEHYIVDVVEPGTRLSRTIVVGNATPDPLVFDVYVAGAVVADGSFQLADDDASDLEAWSSVDDAELHVEPGATASTQVRLVIPDDAPDGERYGVVWAQPRPGVDSTVVSRVGVRAYLLVDADGRASSDLHVTRMTPRRDDGGAAEVVLGLENTGARAVDVAGELTLADDVHDVEPSGDVVSGLTLAPGESGEARIAFAGDVPNGPWRARLVLAVNGLERRAAASVEFPAGDGETGAPVDVTMVATPSRRSPVLAAVAGALAAAALVATARVRLGGAR